MAQLQPPVLTPSRLNRLAPTEPMKPFLTGLNRVGVVSKPGICSVTARVSEPEVRKRLPYYQPTSWSYSFLQSLQPRQDETQSERADVLEEEIRAAMDNENSEPIATLLLIDDVQRLGLGFRFEEDIERALRRYVSREKQTGNRDRTLYATSLAFRLLRQHGFQVSPDVFKIFMDGEGKFSESLKYDINGMLMLYEASHLAHEGEVVLEDAKIFATKHLRKFENVIIDSNLMDQVNHSLEQPLHHRMRWQEARWYIESCTTRKDMNRSLLELAVLNFNSGQIVLQRDLQSASRWWNGTGLASEMTFARDRLMECFFWTVGMACGPSFSNCRKGLSKVTSFITVIDDLYDVYGTIDELELFTRAIERWDVNAVDELPQYMKLCFLALYNTVHEMAYDTLKEHGQNIIPCLTKVWADVCKAFLLEAKWARNNTTPTFDEYLENGWVSVSGSVILVHAYFLCSPNITKQGIESLMNYHDLLRWPSTIFRLCNDLATSSAELERGETANSIRCYMLETGASEELAWKHVNELIGSAWNKMNECQLRDSNFSKPFIEMAFNLARISHCVYHNGDSHGAPDSGSKNRVRSLLLEPISHHILI